MYGLEHAARALGRHRNPPPAPAPIETPRGPSHSVAFGERTFADGNGTPLVFRNRLPLLTHPLLSRGTVPSRTPALAKRACRAVASDTLSFVKPALLGHLRWPGGSRESVARPTFGKTLKRFSRVASRSLRKRESACVRCRSENSERQQPGAHRTSISTPCRDSGSGASSVVR